MILNEQQRNELHEASKPLIRWMRDNCHPHCEAVVTQVEVEVKEGICREDYTKFEPEHYN